jgi:hypothetical protein
MSVSPAPRPSIHGDGDGEDESQLFAEELARVEATIELPYPARAEVIEELAADLQAAYREERALGQSEESARRRALCRLGLDEDQRRALEGVHAPAPWRLLHRLSPAVRSWLRAATSAAPLAALVVFLMVEIPVNEFLRNGGPVVTMVIAFGSLGLLLEMQRFFIWFVLRDHSREALKRNNPTPLYLAAATVLLGLMGTAFRYYRFLGRLPADLPSLRLGLSEPLTAIIMACCLAALTVLLHGALTAGLRAIRVPDEKT